MSIWRVCLVTALLICGALLTVGAWVAATLAPPTPRGVSEGQMRPRWKVGARWIVETVTRPDQARNRTAKDDKPAPFRWQFTVARVEKLAGRDCFRLEVIGLTDKNAQPKTTLWVDTKALAVRQIQTQMPVPGGFTTLTESYDFGDGQPGPVLGPLTALPLELPVFVAGRAGGEQTFDYAARTGPATAKRAPDDVSFGVRVTQSIKPVTPAKVKGLVPPEFSRDLKAEALAEVVLKTDQRQARQVWQAGRPWPVFSSNGTTEARLIRVTPPRGEK